MGGATQEEGSPPPVNDIGQPVGLDSLVNTTTAGKCSAMSASALAMVRFFGNGRHTHLSSRPEVLPLMYLHISGIENLSFTI